MHQGLRKNSTCGGRADGGAITQTAAVTTATEIVDTEPDTVDAVDVDSEDVSPPAMTPQERTRAVTALMARLSDTDAEVRQAAREAAEAAGARLVIPPMALCTDNGAMIALAGYYRLAAGQQQDLTIGVTPRWPMHSIGRTAPSRCAEQRSAPPPAEVV